MVDGTLASIPEETSIPRLRSGLADCRLTENTFRLRFLRPKYDRSRFSNGAMARQRAYGGLMDILSMGERGRSGAIFASDTPVSGICLI